MNLPATAAQVAWMSASLPAWYRFRSALEKPVEAQERILRRLLKRNAHSAYGLKHGFGSIRSYTDFSRRVPLVDYEDMEPWIRQIMAGESSVLTREPATHLVPTGGSSGGRKWIPFTASLKEEFNAAIGPWTCDLWLKHPSALLGPAYWSVTPVSNKPEEVNSAVPVGFEDDAEYLGGMRRRLVNAAMAVPPTLRSIGDLELHRRASLLLLLRQADLRLISVWHPSFLTLLLDALPASWEDILADIRDGGSSRTCGSTHESLRSLRLPANRLRAAELSRADPKRPETLWPRLCLVSCWGDAQAANLLSDLVLRMPSVAFQSKGLLATEAAVTIPFCGAHPIAVNSHFYEFIDENGVVHPIEGLRESGVYEVIVTTGGGLWRYRLGDQVKVTGFVGRTPSVCFLGRTGLVSDLVGEKLTEAFVAEALRETWREYPSIPSFAMLAPESSSCYSLYVEGYCSDDLAQRLDAALCRNPAYAYGRKLGQLDVPRVVKIRTGAHRSFIATEVRRGRVAGEIKPVALSPRRNWAAEFSVY
jgi:hypothetical protein